MEVLCGVNKAEIFVWNLWFFHHKYCLSPILILTQHHYVMRRRVKKYNSASCFELNLESPIIVSFAAWLSFMLHVLWNFCDSLNFVHETRRNCRKNLQFVESVQADFHLLQKWNNNSEFSLWRNVTYFKIENILAICVNCSNDSLSSLTFGLFVLFFCLLFLFYNSFNFHITELSWEFINRRLRADWQRVIYFKKLFSRVQILLCESNIKKTIYNFELVVDVFERN